MVTYSLPLNPKQLIHSSVVILLSVFSSQNRTKFRPHFRKDFLLCTCRAKFFLKSFTSPLSKIWNKITFSFSMCLKLDNSHRLWFIVLISFSNIASTWRQPGQLTSLLFLSSIFNFHRATRSSNEWSGFGSGMELKCTTIVSFFCFRDYLNYHHGFQENS